MPLPRSREETEAVFANGDDPSFTKEDLLFLAREYHGMPGSVRYLDRAQVAELLGDPDRRPTLMAIMEDRYRAAYERQAERRTAIVEGLRSRPGRWRFAAIGKFANNLRTDDISGLEFSSGLLVRDTKTHETLSVGGPTATVMRKRKQLTYYDIDRLPVVGSPTPSEETDTQDEVVEQILDSIFGEGPQTE
jgi:hypothetical protein